MVEKAKKTDDVGSRSSKESQSTLAAKSTSPTRPKRKLDRAARLTFVGVGAATGALLLTALIWVSVANLTPTKIERVVFEYRSGGSLCADIKEDEMGAEDEDEDKSGSEDETSLSIQAIARECKTSKLDETNRAEMLAVEQILRENGIKKDDEFCANYTYQTGSYRPSYDDGQYNITIYWRDGTKQEMGCTTKNAASNERWRINSIRSAIGEALTSRGFINSRIFDFNYKYYDYYDLY